MIPKLIYLIINSLHRNVLSTYYILGAKPCETIKNAALERTFFTLLHLKCNMHYATENYI